MFDCTVDGAVGAISTCEGALPKKSGLSSEMGNQEGISTSGEHSRWPSRSRKTGDPGAPVPGRMARRRGNPAQRFTLSTRLFRIKARADVAQLVEQPIRNRQVSGSSPLVGSRFYAGLSDFRGGERIPSRIPW